MNKIKRLLKNLILLNLLILIINKLINIISNINNIFDSKKLNVFKSSLGDVSYKVIGNGKPLLLIHNSIPGDSIYEWQYIENNFTDRKVFVINLLGCGSSEKTLIKYTNYIYVTLVNEFIKKVIKEKTDIVTSSMSCNIGLGSLLNNAMLIDKVIMINPETNTKLSRPCYLNLIKFPIIGSFIYNILYSKNSIDQKELFMNNNFRIQAYKKKYYDSIHYKNTNSRFLYESIFNNDLYLDFSYAISKITNSIYIISSKNNNSELINTLRNNRNIKYYKINKASIYPHIDNPDEISKKISNILE